MGKMTYTVYGVNSGRPELDCDWHASAWNMASVATVSHVCSQTAVSIDKLPEVSVRLLHDEDAFWGMFLVKHEFSVLSENTKYHGEIWKDSCVECFLQPPECQGYFNLEMNAGGFHLISYNLPKADAENPAAREIFPIPEETGKCVTIRSSLGKGKISPELPGPTDWILQFEFPVSIMRKYCNVGADALKPGAIWHGSFYKCAENNRYPHWMSWQKLQQTLFHQAATFGEFQIG